MANLKSLDTEYKRLAAKFAQDIHGENRRQTYRDAVALRYKVGDLQRAAQARWNAAIDARDEAKTPQERARMQRAMDQAKREEKQAKAEWDKVWNLSAAARNSPETTQRWLETHKSRTKTSKTSEKWPHDHSDKHAAAARKGWATRRRKH